VVPAIISCQLHGAAGFPSCDCSCGSRPRDFPTSRLHRAIGAPHGQGSTLRRRESGRNTGRYCGRAAGCSCRESPGLMGNAAILQEANHRGHPHDNPSRMQTVSVRLFHHSDAFQHQYDGAARCADIDGLVRRIQYQHRSVHGRMWPWLFGDHTCMMHISCQ